MTPELLKVLAEIASHGRVECETPEQLAYTDKLFQLGVIHISPPGWCYVINAKGRALLDNMAAASRQAEIADAAPEQQVA